MAVNIPDRVTVDWSHFELLQWVNESLQADFSKIEELCTGAAYCQYMDMLFPGSILLKSVHFWTNNKAEFNKNFKILAESFKKLNVDKIIPIENLTMGRFKENFQFVIWFKHFFNANYVGRPYDAIAVRHFGLMGYGPNIGMHRAKALPVVKRQMLNTKSKTLPQVKKPKRVDSHGKLMTRILKRTGFDFPGAYNQLDECARIKIEMKKEQLLYSTKLQDIENICDAFDNRGDNPLIERIREIIRLPTHGFVVDPDQQQQQPEQ